MNPKLPVVSGRQVIKVLERIGYRVVRQKGSHVRLFGDTRRAEAEPVSSTRLQRLQGASTSWRMDYASLGRN